MRPRIGRRWATPFGQWVIRQTVPEVARQLAGQGHPVTRRTVYAWVHGTTSPRVQVASALVKISAGALSLEQVYEHRVRVTARHPDE